MNITYQQKIDKKYTDLKKVYQSADENSDILIRLLAQELIVIADCNIDLATNGLVVVVSSGPKANPCVIIRATSTNAASRIIRQIYQMNAESDDAIPTDLDSFLKLK